ncbi:MAG: adenylate/guanylate cyclase domain-containing protein [Rhodococcus sp. (in: high G+C Gram-positive bacteria)]
MDLVILWIVAAGVELAAIIALGVLLIVSRRQLTGARRDLRRALSDTKHRRRRRGVAPFAIRTVFHTADSLISKGIGATVRNSIEDLAGWAKVERPDLARMTADGDIVVMFSDIEGSTARNQDLGDRGWVKLLEKHDRLIRKHVDTHGGHVVKNQGDGYMIAFSDPTRAVRCGIEVQRALQENPDRWDGIRVRMGVHVGSSVRRGDDIFGLNVAMAARVAGQADGAEILVSESIRDAIATAHDIALGEPRDVELKGITGSHQLFPVELALNTSREALGPAT